MDQPLDDPLAELVGRLLRVEVEEPDQVHEQERSEEGEQHRRRARDAVAPAAEAVDRPNGEKRDRRDVGEIDRARDVPVHLLERRAEDGRQKERAHEADFARHGHHLRQPWSIERRRCLRQDAAGEFAWSPCIGARTLGRASGGAGEATACRFPVR